jgi:hypothetical protein
VDFLFSETDFRATTIFLYNNSYRKKSIYLFLR